MENDKKEVFKVNEISIEKVNNNTIGMFAGFTMGFLLGAAIVAIIDYHDERNKKIKRIKRDSDENYIYSE